MGCSSSTTANVATKAKAKKAGNAKACLLIIDVQNDFISGSLAVGDAASIIAPINKLRDEIEFGVVVLTQDSHPPDHCSFADNNEGATLFTVAQIPIPLRFLSQSEDDGGAAIEDHSMDQMMWPRHCVKGTVGHEFHKDLFRSDSDYVQKKGQSVDVDSYSGFFDNFKGCSTGLRKYLHEKGVEDVYCCGLALDFCVGSTAIDAEELGFKVFVIEDCCRSVAPDSAANMITKLKNVGVTLCAAKDVPGLVASTRGSTSRPRRKHRESVDVVRCPALTSPKGGALSSGSWETPSSSSENAREGFVRQNSINPMKEEELAPTFHRQSVDGAT